MVTLNYRVHGIASTGRSVKATFQGEQVDAVVEQFEVELTHDDDPTHGSLTLRFVGGDAVKARAAFRADETGTLTWTPSRGA